ncbi:MAG: BamA/TamA family outer membrane protein [Bacteroidales bacterium]
MKGHPVNNFMVLVILLIMSSCSTVKFVKEGEYLLDRVEVKSDTKRLKPADLEAYVRQKPNLRVFGLYNMQLQIYNLSGRDSTKRINKFIRKVGEAPVIYSPEESSRTLNELRKVAQNRGYLHAVVDTTVQYKKRKVKLVYDVKSGVPYRISDYEIDISNHSMDSIIVESDKPSLIRPSHILDMDLMEKERQRVTSILRNNGYYAINRDHFSYFADSTMGGNIIDLTLKNRITSVDTSSIYRAYRIGDITIDLSFDPALQQNVDIENKLDTLHYKGYKIIYREGEQWLRPQHLTNACMLTKGDIYKEETVNETYVAFSRISIIRFININFEPSTDEDGVVNVSIKLSKGKSQGFAVELEGTNSAGDLGAAVSLSYKHSNLFRGGESFVIKGRSAYEQLTGGGLNNNYMELGAETAITFPRFLFPFLKHDFRKKVRANTEFSFEFNYQNRPEYSRVVSGIVWRYKWTMKEIHRHTLDFVDLSYTYLPSMSDEFREQLDQQELNPVLRNSYENNFIMRTGYTYYLSNNTQKNKNRPIRYTLRAGIESAGNSLAAISSLLNLPKNDGGYEVLGIRFAQYVKLDAEYAMNYRIDQRNNFVWRAGVGVAYPYGNLTVIPFENRYFSGGANSVRAWGIRSLGPGRYAKGGSGIDFINQSGDIKLDLNVEYRSYLFWKLHAAFFIDAGNIWTIREYDNQPGGQFQIDQFYKEIALGYGVGLRLDFDYFVLRLDLGVKAYDPSMSGRDSWRIIQPRLNQDFTLNFAVGYPF